MIKKVVFLCVLPITIIIILVISVFSMSFMNSKRNNNEADEQAINLQIEGEVSNETLKAISAPIPDGDVGSINIDSNSTSVSSSALVGTASPAVEGAIAWAENIAADDDWVYNWYLKKKATCKFCNPKHRKCYTCMPFITAAFAHGANDPEMLKLCSHGGSGGGSLGTTDKNFTKYSCWQLVGRCKDLDFSELQRGDVICYHDTTPEQTSGGHLWMYLGGDDYIDSTGLGGSPQHPEKWRQPDNIAKRSGAKKQFNRYKKHGMNYVMRYVGTGNGAVDLSGATSNTQMDVSGSSWMSVSGGVTTGKITSDSNLQFVKGDRQLVTVGNPKSTEGNGISTSTVSGGSGAAGAVAWAQKIASDDSFSYAQPGKCHVCESSRPQTYCCASFVCAAFAHGAGDSGMKTRCSDGSACSVPALHEAMQQSSNFAKVGSFSSVKSQLQPGDILFRDVGWPSGHVDIYSGNGKQVGAHTSATGIYEGNMGNDYSEVWRYTGAGGSVNGISGGSANQTYDTETILKTISMSDLELVAGSFGGSRETAQSFDYMGNNKYAVAIWTHGDAGTRLAIFNGNKQEKTTGKHGGGWHSNGLAYVNGKIYLATGKNDSREIKVFDAETLEEESSMTSNWNVYALGYDSHTKNLAITNGGSVIITNDNLTDKKVSVGKKSKSTHTQDCGASRGVVYETQSNKSTHNIISMYSEENGAYLGTYKLDSGIFGSRCEIESADVDEAGHLLLLLHKHGTHENYIYKTKDILALTESTVTEGTTLEGMTIRQDIICYVRYKKENASVPVLGTRVYADEYVPNEEQLAVANKVAAALSQRGYSQAAIAGVLGNLHVESGMNPAAVNGSSGASGLAQWLGGRLTNLKKLAASQGKDWTDVDVQIQHLCHELDGSESAADAAMKGIVDVAEAAKTWDKKFERSEGTSVEARIKWANAYYGKVTGGGVSSTNCDVDICISIDQELNKCVATGTINERTIESVGDVAFKDGSYMIKLKGLGSAQGGEISGNYVSGQLSGMRTSIPERNNKWYNPPINRFPHAYVGNCTWYAFGRFLEIAGRELPDPPNGNAHTFYDHWPSCTHNPTTPAVGALVCWEYPGGGYGHVAVVEEVKPNGDIVTSESAYTGSVPFTMGSYQKSNNYRMGNGGILRGFIYQPGQ